MKFRDFALWILITSVAFGVGACKKEEKLETRVEQTIPIIKTIDGEEYKFEDNKVTQLSEDEDNMAKYGVISDIHGEVDKAKLFADEFKKLGVDGIIIPGDIPLNESLRYGGKDSRDDKIEIFEVLSAIAKTELPIFVIPGNHERKKDYEQALSEVISEYPNVIDMTKFRVFDGDDVDFVSLPGYQTFKSGNRQFIPNDGYWAKPNFINATGKLREGLDDAVILITHGAGKTTGNGKAGPGTIYNGEDVGDENTRKMMKKNNIPFAIVGHIHEAGGLAATHDGHRVMEGEWAKQFTANFGTLERWEHLNGETYNGMAGIFTVKGDEAKYEMLILK